LVDISVLITASLNRQHQLTGEGVTCSNKAEEMDVSGVASQTRPLILAVSDGSPLRAIFWREENEEKGRLEQSPPASAVLPVRLTFLTGNQDYSPETALCFVPLFVSRK
jgi:hypothetical protein